jgi:hypothetical protein
MDSPGWRQGVRWRLVLALCLLAFVPGLRGAPSAFAQPPELPPTAPLLAASSPNLSCSTDGAHVTLRNGSYVARIVKSTGGFTVHRTTAAGEESAVTNDGVVIRYDPFSHSFTDADLRDRQVSVEKCYSFYGRVRVHGFLPASSGMILLTRTYEFTRSSSIYEQLALRYTGGAGALTIREWIWGLGTTSTHRVKVQAITDDLLVQIPDGPLGGLNAGLAGHHAPCRPQPACRQGPSRLLVTPQGQLADGAIAQLPRGQFFLANRVISLNADREPVPDFSRYPYPTYQFYPTMGLRVFDPNAGKYYLNEWNSYKYAMDNVVPIPSAEINRQTEDWLIRLTMHLVERLALDDGWWRNFPWTVYPAGDRGAANGRSFPALAYVWAHLTLQKTPQGWRHIAGDADVIYHQLQRTYGWFVASDPANRSIATPGQNLADHRPSGTPYIAYSQALKQRYDVQPSDPSLQEAFRSRPKGTINAHGHALHFAWLMIEASRFYGDPVRESLWREIVRRYHQGSKELFHVTYPAQQPRGRTLLGLIGYSEQGPQVSNTPPFSTAYSSITFETIAAGYAETGEYEPQFADIVERASRLDTDPFDRKTRNAPLDQEDPPDPKLEPCPIVGYAARLARVFPATLAFAMSEEALPRYFMDGLRLNRPCDPWDDEETTSHWATWDTYRDMKVLAGDFNGDGKTDVMKFDVPDSGIQPLGLWVGLSDGRQFNGSRWVTWDTYRDMKVLAGDFNGDGKTDVMKFDVPSSGTASLGLWVGLSDGTTFSGSRWATWETYKEMMVLAGDFNGDGKTDVMKFDVNQAGREAPGGLWVGLSDGRQFHTTQWATWTTSPHMKVLVGDFNGDGKADVMKFDVDPSGRQLRGGLWVGISDGRSFQTTLWSRWDTTPEMMVLAGDFGGDRAADVMKFDVPRSGIARQGLWVGLSEPVAHDGPDMSRDLSVASLREALESDRQRDKTVHTDPAKFIKEGGGRKWILTNTRFKTTWAPSFWEEVDAQSVPLSERFGIQVTVPSDQTLGHYSAFRMGNQIFIMTDFTGGTMTLELQGPTTVSASRQRIYEEQSGRWGPVIPLPGPRVRPGPGGKVLVDLGTTQRKTLIIVDVRP